MDTDSFYLVMSGDSLDGIVRLEMKQVFLKLARDRQIYREETWFI